MSRIGWVLVGLLAVLLAVGWFFLIFSPTSDEIEQVRADTDRVLAEAAQQRARAAELREVRQSAPEAEAMLAAGQTLIPEEPSIPALFRQLQQAADESGARLPSINVAAPSVVTVGDEQVASIGVSVTLEGTYFQIVDLARRIEDPSIMPRALRWDAAAIAPGSELPELNVSLAGQVYSRGIVELPSVEEPPEIPEDAEEDAVLEEGDLEDDDLEEGTP